MSASIRQPAGSDREMLFTRVFDAPVELVFQAWAEPAQITNWWGPHGFSTTTHEMDLRSGGHWRFTMHAPDGTDFKNHIVYIEVRKYELLHYRHSGLDETADVQFEVRVEFSDNAGRTTVSMRSIFPTAEELTRVIETYGAEEGARQTLDRLGEHLNTIQGETNV